MEIDFIEVHQLAYIAYITLPPHIVLNIPFKNKFNFAWHSDLTHYKFDIYFLIALQ